MRFARISTLDICKQRSGYVTSHKNSIIREQYTSQFKLFSYTRSFVSYIFLEGIRYKIPNHDFKIEIIVFVVEKVSMS